MNVCAHCGERIINSAFFWLPFGWYHQTESDAALNVQQDQGLRKWCRVTQATPGQASGSAE